MYRSGTVTKFISTCFALTFVIPVILSGCGKAGLPKGYWTLYSIEEKGKLVEEDDLADYGLDDAYVVVDKDGSGYAVLFGIPSDFSCDRDESCFDFDGLGSVDYGISGKELTLADENVTMIFKKSREDEPEKPEARELVSYTIVSEDNSSSEYSAENGSSDGSDAESSASSGSKKGLSKLLSEDDDTESDTSGNVLDADNPYDFFNGDWFGYWTIDAHKDIYKPYDGEKFDVLCRIDMNDDHKTGTMRLWDYGEYSYEHPFSEVEISVRDGLDRNIKAITSESGYFSEDEIEHADWIIDPGLYDASNYILVDARYTDSNGDLAYYYYIHLKKWGADWDDLDDKPLRYDWYKDLIDKGEKMPDEIPEL